MATSSRIMYMHDKTIYVLATRSRSRVDRRFECHGETVVALFEQRLHNIVPMVSCTVSICNEDL